MIRKMLFAATCAFLTLSAGTNALAIGPAGLATPLQNRFLQISTGKPTLAPFAFVRFCLTNAAECQIGTGRDRIELTPGLARQLRQVNFEVNRSIEPENDAAGRDDWNIGVARGDCEDYVLTKRSRLIRLGWPANALRIAVTHTPRDNGHAVLVVSTSSGDMVLDNRTNSVRNWQDTDLRWEKIQSSENPLFWNEI